MRIKLIDVDNRLSTKFNKVDGVHNWGEDNAYPQLVKSIINSSVTSKSCVDLNAKYTYGKGFEFSQNVSDKSTLIVDKDNTNINELLRLVSREFAELNNFFLHINYNALYEITSVILLDCEDVRIGKVDSTGYAGKYIVYDNWDRSKSRKIEKKDFKIIDKYNSNSKIIELQVENAGGWTKYNGQILHVKKHKNKLYALADVDSVLYDADSEYQASLFKNSGLRKGFFGAKLFVTKPFSSDGERRDFEKTIQDLKGSENSSGVLLLEASAESDVLSENILIQNIDSNIDDKKFESTEKSTSRNITKAFGIPSILINQDSDGSLFGNSGQLINQAKLMHWENKEEERDIIQETFEMLFSKFHFPINPTNNWKIVPIITTKSTPVNE